MGLACGFVGGWCVVEDGYIVPASNQQFVSSWDVTSLAIPLSIPGRGVVSYGGKYFAEDALQKILARGKKYAIDAGGYLVERAPASVKEYDVIRYGAEALKRHSGFDAHHGVLDSWFKSNNYPGYNTLDAPAMMLNPGDHAKTKNVFNNWAIDRFGSTANIDWAVVSQNEIMDLAGRMFNAANVPQQAQSNYYTAFWYYINNLEG